MANTSSVNKRTIKLRDKLFLSFSFLSIVILIAAGWVINSLVVTQARQRVREEIEASLPLYDAVWEEQEGRLSSLGMAMAGSPVVKTIFGDPRASRDRETVRQMLADFGDKLAENADLIMICNGGGRVTFVEGPDPSWYQPQELPPAQEAAMTQKPAQSFALLNGRLFHLAFTPVTSHSASAGINNTLAVLVTGVDLDRRLARELGRRARSDVLFFAGEVLYASSLQPELERSAAEDLTSHNIGGALESPTELTIAGESQLAFVKQLSGFDGKRIGYVVILHSLGEAGRLFRAITNRLALIGTISILLVLFLSYIIARRVTQPIELLSAGAREFGIGNYDYKMDLPPEGEVGQLAAAFEQMCRSIKQGQAVLIKNERLATIGQMASGIIHDLRNPLAAISTAADLIASAELSPQQRKLMAQSQIRSSQRMEAMLKELLDYSRGKYELTLERRELASLLNPLIQELMTPDISSKITVRVLLAPGLEVRVDRERARRMFENLLINSLQAMPKGGTITVRGDKSGDRVRINISDTGSGIPAQLRDRLFEPFVSQGKRSGTGLGLAIARSIAEAHGGALTLVSAENQPADFCIELPLDRESSPGE